MNQPRKIAVLGCGRNECGDDAAGVFVVGELIRRGPHPFEVCNIADDPLRLFDFCRDFDRVIVVDAACTGAAPGTIHRFSSSTLPPAHHTLVTSTHGIHVDDVVALAAKLDCLPPHLTIIGIEGARFTAGAGMSPAVVHAVEEVVNTILEELAAVCPNNA